MVMGVHANRVHHISAVTYTHRERYYYIKHTKITAYSSKHQFLLCFAKTAEERNILPVFHA